jgi:peptidyl-prolyl cis-trans isomerase D
MSVLEKIRSRSGLLVGIIAVALLVFILESALDSGNRFFGANRTKVGEIGGKDVSIQEFEAKSNARKKTQLMRLEWRIFVFRFGINF